MNTEVMRFEEVNMKNAITHAVQKDKSELPTSIVKIIH